MPASTVVQAVIGGITVRTGLLWWTVAIHLLVSMAMVWLSVLLYVKVGEPDSAWRERLPRCQTAARLDGADRAEPGAVLVTGTLVTGRRSARRRQEPASRTVPRLKVEITTLVHVHSSLLVAYLSLVVGLGCGLSAVGAPGRYWSPRRAAGAWCAPRPPSAPCSTSPGCPPPWSPSTWRARPPAPRRPRRYGPRCDSGPRPSRSRADSTPTANCAGRGSRVSGVEPPPAQRRLHQLAVPPARFVASPIAPAA